MYPTDRYRYFQTKTKDGKEKVIAVSTYAGRTVRGTAICDTADTFDLEKGKQIAAARCAVRIAEKRVARAERKSDEAEMMLAMVRKRVDDMDAYLVDADAQLEDALDHLSDVLSEN